MRHARTLLASLLVTLGVLSTAAAWLAHAPRWLVRFGALCTAAAALVALVAEHDARTNGEP